MLSIDHYDNHYHQMMKYLQQSIDLMIQHILHVYRVLLMQHHRSILIVSIYFQVYNIFIINVFEKKKKKLQKIVYGHCCYSIRLAVILMRKLSNNLLQFYLC